MKKRLDQLVVERGFAPSREAAKRLVLAGKIAVEGEISDKAGRSFPEDCAIELRGPKSPYVGRGGTKLAGALDAFEVDVAEVGLALDIGTSTGGFTDCLLQRGVRRVVAVDTGRGQIHERLRADDRVVLLERTNARYLTLDRIGGRAVDLIVIDVSFISLRLILPACKPIVKPEGSVIALVKPQFEAGRRQVGSGGVVRDPEVHREVLGGIVDFSRGEGWRVTGVALSPLTGADGNVEFFIRLEPRAAELSDGTAAEEPQIDIEPALDAAYNLRKGTDC